MAFRPLFLGTLFSFSAAPALSAPVVFQEVPEIVELYKTPQIFCKITPTMGRLPAPEMIGKEFSTYVSDGKSATIRVPWTPEGMTAHKGGYLAELEYAIAPEEMKANAGFKQ